MKEEIERRRAEAAERRQKVGEEVDGDTSKLFKCVSPRGSSLKVSSHSFSPSLPCFPVFHFFSCLSVLTDSQEHTGSTNAHSAVSHLMRGRTAYRHKEKIVSKKNVCL